VVFTSGADGVDQFVNVENFQWGNAAAVSLASLQAASTGLVYASLDGAPAGYVLPDAYSGPVAGLVNQLLGSSGADVILGTEKADFINAGAGDDAIDGGAGNDVIDGGAGSNFLTGGAGRDTFFIDGRVAGTAGTWSTITDFSPGEQVTIWGYQLMVSVLLWVASDGVTGFKGATLHADLDGNGLIDTSVTFAGLTQAQLTTPIFGTVGGNDYIFIN
jgi:Ca2+-binding RTX toxin-like protein